MRNLFLLSAIVVVFLAIDAAEFDGYYRRTICSDVWYEGQALRYKLVHSLSSYVDDAVPSRR